MNQEQKSIFNRRITQSNPSEMICVLYDMLLLDLKEAADILEEDDRQYEKANDCLRHATQIL